MHSDGQIMGDPRFGPRQMHEQHFAKRVLITQTDLAGGFFEKQLELGHAQVNLVYIMIFHLIHLTIRIHQSGLEFGRGRR